MGEIDDQWIRRRQSQQCGKGFHGMTVHEGWLSSATAGTYTHIQYSLNQDRKRECNSWEVLYYSLE